MLEKMEEPKSVRFLALKRSTIKGKISRLVNRLKYFEENNQLPSMSEIRVFAEMSNKFYEEFSKVCDEFEVSDAHAGDRFVHDIEWAKIVSCFQDANQRIAALNNVLVTQSVQAAVSEPQQQSTEVPEEDANRTPLSTTETCGEGGFPGTGDVPEEVRTTCEPTERVASDAQVCAQIVSSISPPIADTERDEPSCTKCSDCHADPDCFTPGEEPTLSDEAPQETNPNLSNQRLAESSPASESLCNEHEVLRRKGPEAVPQEASPDGLGGVDESADSETPEPEFEVHVDDVPGEDETSLNERGNLDESGDSEAVSTPMTAENGDDEPDEETCQPVKEDSLLATETDDENNEEFVRPGCREPPSCSRKKRRRGQVASKAPIDNKDGLLSVGGRLERASLPEKAKQPVRSGVAYAGLHYVSARSGVDCAIEAGNAVEKLPESAISSSTVKSPRLVWDPGVQPSASFRSGSSMTTTRWQ